LQVNYHLKLQVNQQRSKFYRLLHFQVGSYIFYWAVFIVTEHPYLKYTDHALVVKYGPDISIVCGKAQFMGASVGCEIVAHLIRNRLKADPSLVVGKMDCKNAFNAIHKEPMPSCSPSLR
jgi:hypothetical protein